MSQRKSGRLHDQIRPVLIEPGYITHPEGSVLFSMGDTRVLCNVSVEAGVPPWMESRQMAGGWVTAEYALLPRSTHQRTSRETLRPRGRTQEISRLIGRSLRAAIRLERLPAVTCTVDCDVLQADGGTRSAAISGGYLALLLALRSAPSTSGEWLGLMAGQIAAISVGKVDGELLVDLDYEEDSSADADLNLVMNAAGEYIEIQASAEHGTFNKAELDQALKLGEKAIMELMEAQREILADLGIDGQVWERGAAA
jgi:ribonuclease PH